MPQAQSAGRLGLSHTQVTLVALLLLLVMMTFRQGPGQLDDLPHSPVAKGRGGGKGTAPAPRSSHAAPGRKGPGRAPGDSGGVAPGSRGKGGTATPASRKGEPPSTSPRPPRVVSRPPPAPSPPLPSPLPPPPAAPTSEPKVGTARAEDGDGSGGDEGEGEGAGGADGEDEVDEEELKEYDGPTKLTSRKQRGKGGDGGEDEDPEGGKGGGKGGSKSNGGAAWLAGILGVKTKTASPPAPSGRSYRKCGGKRTTRPTLKGLPVRLPMKLHGRISVDVGDIFVNQDNFRNLHFEDEIKNPKSLPKDFADVLQKYRLRSCAVVGNGGQLRLTKQGKAISSHDTIMRMNQGPVRGYESQVGDKTTMRMLNNLWTKRYALGSEFVHKDYNCRATLWDDKLRRDICLDGHDKDKKLPLEQRATLLASRADGEEYTALQKFISKERKDVSFLYLSPRVVSAARRLLGAYRTRLCDAGYGPFGGGNTPSSGLIGLYVMMQLCRRVTVYGFGKYVHHDRRCPYHYYTGIGMRTSGTSVHSWGAENALVEQMAEEGYINLCTVGPKYNTREERQAECMCGFYNHSSLPLLGWQKSLYEKHLGAFKNDREREGAGLISRGTGRLREDGTRERDPNFAADAR